MEVHIWTGEELGRRSTAGDRARGRLGGEANRRLAFALAPRATAGALLLAALPSLAPLAASIATPAAAVAATPGEADDPNTTAEDAGDGGDAPSTLPPDVQAGLYDDDAPPPDDVHDDSTTAPDPSAAGEGGQPATPGESPQAPPATPEPGSPTPGESPQAPPATPEPQPASPPPEQQPGAPEPTPAATSQPPAPQPQPAPPVAPTPAAQPPAAQRTVAAPRTRSAAPHRLFSTTHARHRRSALSGARAPMTPAQRSGATARPTTRVAFAIPARRTTSLDRIGGRSYRVHTGDSLWAIARRTLGPRASAADIARTVHVLWRLNANRIASGTPDLIAVGTELRLPN